MFGFLKDKLKGLVSKFTKKVEDEGKEETIEVEKNGLLWNTKSELVKFTTDLIVNPKKLKSISLEAKKTSEKYSYEEFTKKVQSIVA